MHALVDCSAGDGRKSSSLLPFPEVSGEEGHDVGPPLSPLLLRGVELPGEVLRERGKHLLVCLTTGSATANSAVASLVLLKDEQPADACKDWVNRARKPRITAAIALQSQ